MDNVYNFTNAKPVIPLAQYNKMNKSTARKINNIRDKIKSIDSRQSAYNFRKNNIINNLQNAMADYNNRKTNQKLRLSKELTQLS